MAMSSTPAMTIADPSSTLALDIKTKIKNNKKYQNTK